MMEKREAALAGGTGMIKDTPRTAQDENTGADTVTGRMIVDVSLIDTIPVRAEARQQVSNACKALRS